MTKCRWPDHTVIVDPQGYLKPCCMMTGHDMQNPEYIDQNYNKDEIMIDRIPLLEDFAYSEFVMNLRKSINQNGVEGTPICHNCVKRVESGSHMHADEKVFTYINKPHEEYTPGEISYLEITTSNICNQTCITCSSYFSTKWRTIEHLFGSTQFNNTMGPDYVMSEESFQKILGILPQIKTIMIKGGEPFSDLRNAKILERLAEVNPNCTIWITSNCSIISKRFMDVLKRFNPANIHMIASLDHIGKKYEWIRGTNFKQTLSTLKKLNEEVGITPAALPTVSYFNILDIHEIIDFYNDLPHVEISQNLFSMNILMCPYEMDMYATRTQEELDTINLGLKSKFNQDLYDELQRKIEIMNGIRGFRWQDC